MITIVYISLTGRTLTERVIGDNEEYAKKLAEDLINSSENFVEYKIIKS